MYYCPIYVNKFWLFFLKDPSQMRGEIGSMTCAMGFGLALTPQLSVAN